ncbi:MAG TPA: hypothetical protein VNC78_01675 [Actinomycetota bacterium]|nr:hypothetical protein [Actinomycetota bacterium]
MIRSTFTRPDRVAVGLFLVLALSVVALPRARAETFEATGSIDGMNPAAGTVGGVTENEFIANCAVPASQGLDGYVVELPAAFGDGSATAQVTGDSLAPAYDLDLAFYDAACAFIEQLATAAPDEGGPVPAGTAWIVINQSVGGGTTFVLVVTGPGGGPSGGSSPTATGRATPGGGTGGTGSTTAGPGGGTVGTTLAARPTRTGYNKPFTLSGRVDPDPGCSGPFVVTIKKRVLGNKRYRVEDDSILAGSAGTWEIRLRSPKSASYTASARSAGCNGRVAGPENVLITARVRVKGITSCVAPQRFTGSVAPNHKRTNVLLQRRAGKSYKTLDQAKLNKRSRFMVVMPQCERGTYRVLWPAQSKKNLAGEKVIKLS